MTKVVIFYHDMMHLLKKKNARIMVNYSRYPMPQVEEKNKQYTSRDVNRYARARRFQNISGQPIKKILHAVDNKIQHNLPILREYAGMAENIYVPSVPHLQRKTVPHKIHHVEPIIVKTFPNVILVRYKNVALWCDIVHINDISFLNTISRHIMFATGVMIKYRKINNIEDRNKQVKKIYLQCGFKITCIYSDS